MSDAERNLLRAVLGHALASTERGWIPAQRDQAASDDTRRASAAMDASSIIAPGTDCVEYAEVAPPRSNGDLVHVAVNPPEHVVEKEVIPGGEFPLPHGPSEFVEEIHPNAALFIVSPGLRNSKDEKIRQRAVAKLT